MLYAYLKHFGGICASHTSATGMGTDWRDNDPLVEPVVEIYQGDRNNYECEGAPRGFTPRQSRGQPRRRNEQRPPQGVRWNALAKGYRLGFESSSDHVSTHASYAHGAGGTARPRGALEAFRARRCFAATDNILLVVKCADHLMGEEFASAGQADAGDPRRGNRARSAKLDIVRNNRYVYSATPNTATLDLRWTDADPPGRRRQLLLCPHPAGRHQPGLELADVDPRVGQLTRHWPPLWALFRTPSPTAANTASGAFPGRGRF